MKMGYVTVQNVIQKRKQQRLKTKLEAFKNDLKNQVAQERRTDDVTIDKIIHFITNLEPLTTENKFQLIDIIGKKIGVWLNANTALKCLYPRYCKGVVQIDRNWNTTSQNIFILSGSVCLFGQKNIDKKSQRTYRQIRNIYDEEDGANCIYKDLKQFEKDHYDYELYEEWRQFRSIGPLFNPQQNKENKTNRKFKLIAIDAVFIQIKGLTVSYSQAQNDGLSDEEKLIFLEKFGIFDGLDKKIHKLISNFTLRKYGLNDLIYKKGDLVRSMHFLLDGEIVLSAQIETKNRTQENQQQLTISPRSYMVGTEIINLERLGPISYFGEEEIIAGLKTRIQSVRCASVSCRLLEFKIEGVQKLFESSQLKQILSKNIKMKQTVREQKIELSKQLFSKSRQENAERIQTITQTEISTFVVNSREKTTKKISLKSKSNDLRIMHGNIIWKPPKGRSAEKDSNFSMLTANPDMYASTLKKFRKYNIKPKVKYEPNTSWDFKRVWRALKLEDVLRQDQIELVGSEGRKFFDYSKRLKQQINETKSTRPKTISSNCQTKMQYIAYLQQFTT